MAKQPNANKTILLSICMTLGLSPLTLLAADNDASADDEVLIIEDEAESTASEVLIIEESDSSDEQLVIEEDASEILLIESSDSSDQGNASAETQADIVEQAIESESPFSFRLNELWTEYSIFGDSNAKADGMGYLHGRATVSWVPSQQWEAQASIRVDGYSQHGSQSWDLVDLDYDETFIRYRAENSRVTLGAQRIAWGRIDEFPPTDRLSTHDLSRYIIDDLSDRRRASAAIRYEHFIGNNKWDLVFLPHFREAELPGADSVWFPINRQSGDILGLKGTAATRALVQAAPIDYKASDSDGGFGLRYSGTGEGVDYAVTMQKVRQSMPYFNYNTTRGVLEAKYPRSWVVGGDLGVEAAGAIWRFEAAWQSDAPVTHLSGAFDTVKSVNWGAGVEFFPGDGDARVNLQITGVNHINAPAVLDRTEVYLLGGSFEMPFAQDRWRVKGRFYKGLDTHDLYLNPEIAFTGWDSQEIYLDAHYFDGADGTPGGYHQDHSILSLGWRAKF